MRNGEVVARVIYAKIINDEVDSDSDSGEAVRMMDLDTGKEFEVHGGDLLDTFVSASEYSGSVETTKTDLAGILVNAGHLPFTVTFVKADGLLRTLTGTLVKHETLLGRSMVHEFSSVVKANGSFKGDDGIRLVDHRTIEQIIIDGTRYFLKVDYRSKKSNSAKVDARVEGGRDAFGRYTKSAGYRY